MGIFIITIFFYFFIYSFFFFFGGGGLFSNRAKILSRQNEALYYFLDDFTW